MNDALLETVDSVRQMLDWVEVDGTDGEESYEPLVNRLHALTQSEPEGPNASVKRDGACSQETPEKSQGGRTKDVTETTTQLNAEENDGVRSADSGGTSDGVYNPDVSVGSNAEKAGSMSSEATSGPGGRVLTPIGSKTRPESSSGPESAREIENAHLVARPPISETGTFSAGSSGAVDPADPRRPLEKPDESGPDNRSAAVSDSIRVDVRIIDKLMDLVGELVLARNQILQFKGANGDDGFVATTQRLNLITSELQEGVMKMRMQPIDNVFSKVPRMVRDLSRNCGKQVRVEVDGRSTELDKTLIEAIKDPLIHLIRNAVDHGLETPQERISSGKPVEGTIGLRAYHEGGQVNLEISDDGAGIPVEKIKAKAVERGLIVEEQAQTMADNAALNLIFLPGFSTAAKVTNISGRGVGMDVVKSNVEKIGGTIEVQTALGEGTTFRIKIPLTLAIVPALIVGCAEERFAIPQVNLVELVRLDTSRQDQRIEHIRGVPVYRMRGKLLPLIYLNKELGLKGSVASDTSVNLAVLQADSRQFGLVVDRISDTQEIVVKPLAEQIKDIPSFAGATILGDGRVALILDVVGLAQRAHVVSDVRHRGAALDSDMVQDTQEDEKRPLLLLRGPDDGRMAIPLDRVTRLETLHESVIEPVGVHDVIQYRGEIMPLLSLGDVMPERRMAPRTDPTHPEQAEEGVINVVVSSAGGRSVGVIVEHILDVVEASIELKRSATRAGVIGSIVIQERITEILDMDWIFQSANLAIEQEEEAASSLMALG